MSFTRLGLSGIPRPQFKADAFAGKQAAIPEPEPEETPAPLPGGAEPGRGPSNQRSAGFFDLFEPFQEPEEEREEIAAEPAEPEPGPEVRLSEVISRELSRRDITRKQRIALRKQQAAAKIAEERAEQDRRAEAKADALALLAVLEAEEAARARAEMEREDLEALALLDAEIRGLVLAYVKLRAA